MKTDIEANFILLCATLKNSKKRRYLISANFGVWNTKMALKIENWLWFLNYSYVRDLIKMIRRSAEEYNAQKGLPRRIRRRRKKRKEKKKRRKKRRKKNKRKKWDTQIYHRLLVQCLTMKACLFQNSRQILPRRW
jgi:hypothetical protein